MTDDEYVIHLRAAEQALKLALRARPGSFYIGVMTALTEVRAALAQETQ